MISIAFAIFSALLAAAEIVQGHHQLAALFLGAGALFYLGYVIQQTGEEIADKFSDLSSIILSYIAVQCGITPQEVINKLRLANKKREEKPDAEEDQS